MKKLMENWRKFTKEAQALDEAWFSSALPNPLKKEPQNALIKKMHKINTNALIADLAKLIERNPNYTYFIHTPFSVKRVDRAGGAGVVAKSIKEFGFLFHVPPEQSYPRPFLWFISGKTPEEKARNILKGQYAKMAPNAPTFIVAFPGTISGDDLETGDPKVLNFIMNYSKPINEAPPEVQQQAIKMTTAANKKVQKKGGFNHYVPSDFIVGTIKGGKLTV